MWKQKYGSKATYRELIKIFEQAGYRNNADAVRWIAQPDSDTDDSSSSGEEIEQPQTYPIQKPQASSQLTPATSGIENELPLLIKVLTLQKYVWLKSSLN